MNLIIIGDDTEKIAMEIWRANTNYVILHKNPNVWSPEFIKYIKDKSVIVCTTAEQFEQREINATMDLFIKNNFIPILIAKDKTSIETKMYTAMEDEIPSSVLYIHNKQNKDYNELIKITQGYLLGKGIIQNDNKTLRTPRKRKTKTTTK